MFFYKWNRDINGSLQLLGFFPQSYLSSLVQARACVVTGLKRGKYYNNFLENLQEKDLKFTKQSKSKSRKEAGGLEAWVTGERPPRKSLIFTLREYFKHG